MALSLCDAMGFSREKSPVCAVVRSASDYSDIGHFAIDIALAFFHEDQLYKALVRPLCDRRFGFAPRLSVPTCAASVAHPRVAVTLVNARRVSLPGAPVGRLTMAVCNSAGVASARVDDVQFFIVDRFNGRIRIRGDAMLGFANQIGTRLHAGSSVDQRVATLVCAQNIACVGVFAEAATLLVLITAPALASSEEWNEDAFMAKTLRALLG